MIDEDCIEIYDFNYDNLTIHYGCKEGTHGKFKIKIIDHKTNFIIHQELMTVSPGLRSCFKIHASLFSNNRIILI
jgi:hypothetical protein